MCIFNELRFPSEILFFIVLDEPVIKSSPHPVCTAQSGRCGGRGRPLKEFPEMSALCFSPLCCLLVEENWKPGFRVGVFSARF